ncbi:uncharacterized protein LOC129729786 isoform X2 [Wyeomyia smithii]|uniref:uncharacterized protein LOC129729786 isoform X2 n=1 Tax=Wyeomyia smithii TaxID=174621 RepID=UPI002467B9CB|nr:uncharacterized protein LOC129729786 isoform X2 [Wyeomyia smithii]
MDSTVPEPSKQLTTADALAARREARRKRILENSNNRLTKITGREHNEPPADFSVNPPETIYPDPEDERDVYQQPELNTIFSGAANLPANGDIFQEFSTIFGTAAANGRTGAPPPPVPDSTLVKILRTKIHIALMGIMVYLLFATERQHLIGGNVFILLLGWEVLEVFLLKTYQPKGSFLDVIFLLGGISNKYSQMIVKFAQTLNKVLKDVAFFVFFFVVTHLVWSVLVLGIEVNFVLNYDSLESSVS